MRIQIAPLDSVASKSSDEKCESKKPNLQLNLENLTSNKNSSKSKDFLSNSLHQNKSEFDFFLSSVDTLEDQFGRPRRCHSNEPRVKKLTFIQKRQMRLIWNKDPKKNFFRKNKKLATNDREGDDCECEKDRIIRQQKNRINELEEREERLQSEQMLLEKKILKLSKFLKKFKF